MKFQIICVTAFSALLTACATPSFNYVPVIENISRPELGVVTTASVGEEMLTQGNLVSQDGIFLKSATKASLYRISPGFFPKTGENDEGTYYSFMPGDGINSTAGLGTVYRNPLADPIKAISVSADSNQVCVITVFNVQTCSKDSNFIYENRSNESPSSFQQTLIYSGRIGDKVNIGYREFSGDKARPAFNNDVEYDLSADNVIAYKGAQIEVIEADNRKITYKVIENFR